jgi:hypothetical protein
MKMNNYIVLYKTKLCAPGDNPMGFACHAEDNDHAEEQCLDAEPDVDIVWVVQTESYPAALDNYWNPDDNE